MIKDLTLSDESSVLDEIENKLHFKEDPDAKRARDSFQFFVEKVAKFKTKPFHESLISKLESLIVKKHSGVQHLVVEWPRGYGKCMKWDTLVTMFDGSRKMIKDIVVGDEVLSCDSDLKMVKDFVLAVDHCTVVSGLKVILVSGQSLMESKEHRLLTFDGWKQARELKVGDWLAITKVIPVVSTMDIPDNELKLLAYWLSEGNSIGRGITSADPFVIGEIEDSIKNLDIPFHIYFKKKTKAVTIGFLGSGFKYFLKRYDARRLRISAWDHREVEKRIPEDVFRLSLDKKALFLNRLFRGDGSIEKSTNMVSFSQNHLSLVMDVQELLLHFGVHSHIKYSKKYYTSENKRRIGPFDCWTLRIMEGKSRLRFIKDIGDFGRVIPPNFFKVQDGEFIPPQWRKFVEKQPYGFSLKRFHRIRIDNDYATSWRKVREVAVLTGNKKLLELVNSDIRWEKIKSIEDAGSFRAVDIQTSRGSFIANQLISHNSSIVSVLYPAWLVARDRNIRIINVTNALRLGVEWLRQIEGILTTNFLYRNWFGNLVPDPRSLTWTDTEKIVLGRSPAATHTTFYAIGVGGSALGKRAEVVIADDILEPQEGLFTELQMERIRTWFFNTLYPILEPHGVLVVIGTRQGKNDLYEELVEHLGWSCEIIPALNDKGESNWSERFPTKNLLERKETMGSIFFNLQYMNSIEGLSGDLFKTEWLKYYHDIPENIRKMEGVQVYMGVDPVATSKKTSDYFCIATIAYSPVEHKSYILDLLHVKASPLHQMELLEQQASIWNPTLIAVETNAMQVLFKDLLQRDTPLPIRGIISTASKESRFINMSSKFESGKVLLPANNESMQPFISEWNSFPRGKNDDSLDAMDKALGLIPENIVPAYTKDIELSSQIYQARERSFTLLR